MHITFILSLIDAQFEVDVNIIINERKLRVIVVLIGLLFFEFLVIMGVKYHVCKSINNLIPSAIN